MEETCFLNKLFFITVFLSFFRWPLCGTIGNFSTKAKRMDKSKMILAYLPIVTDEMFPPEIPKSEHSSIRALIHHRAVAHVLTSLDMVQHKGITKKMTFN